MYPLTIIGDSSTADITHLACRAAGFGNISRLGRHQTIPRPTLVCLGANASRVVNALCQTPLESFGFLPDRDQIRLGRSAYLLAELPLGDFYRQRYGSALVNCSEQALRHTLQQEIGEPDVMTQNLSQQDETDAGLNLVCDDHASKIPEKPAYLHASAMTQNHSLRKANVTWLGEGQYIQQRSLPEGVHFDFITLAGRGWSVAQWHPSLHEAFESKSEASALPPDALEIRDHFFQGDTVYLNSYSRGERGALPEMGNTGIEDAWVLSRMLENYEEDVTDALVAYEQFRRVRSKKLHKIYWEELRRMTAPVLTSAWRFRLGMALRARFLPELALQQRDALHEHDVIRGFR
jgi:hypothetical protein